MENPHNDSLNLSNGEPQPLTNNIDSKAPKKLVLVIFSLIGVIIFSVFLFVAGFLFGTSTTEPQKSSQTTEIKSNVDQKDNSNTVTVPEKRDSDDNNEINTNQNTDKTSLVVGNFGVDINGAVPGFPNSSYPSEIRNLKLSEIQKLSCSKMYIRASANEFVFEDWNVLDGSGRPFREEPTGVTKDAIFKVDALVRGIYNKEYGINRAIYCKYGENDNSFLAYDYCFEECGGGIGTVFGIYNSINGKIVEQKNNTGPYAKFNNFIAVTTSNVVHFSTSGGDGPGGVSTVFYSVDLNKMDKFHEVYRFGQTPSANLP